MSNELKSAGEIDIQSVELISAYGRSLDIRNQILSFNIFENIFNPFITGTILIKDSNDLINFFPITGEETLNIKLATPGYTDKGTFIDNRFHVYKVSGREKVADRAIIYELNFISVESIMDLNIKISKAFNDNVKNIADKILNDSSFNSDKTRIHIEPTINSHTYVSNFWSPIQNLNYLAEKAVNVNGSPSFLFFENRNGLNFISLESLYKNKVSQTFREDNYSRKINPDGSSVRNIEKEYQSIIDITTPSISDYINRIRSGAFSSVLIAHDLTTKHYSLIPFDFLDEYDKTTRLNSHSSTSKKVVHQPSAAIKTMNKSTSLFSGGNDISGSKYFQKRKSLLALAESCKVNITVLGRTDYTVGQKVFLELNKKMAIDHSDVDVKDYVFSGNYIISAIKHIINRELHTIDMELIKDSGMIDLNTIKTVLA